MSIKIYNGFRMKALKSKEFLNFINELKEIITNEYVKRYYKLWASNIEEFIDNLRIADAEKDFDKVESMLLSYYIDDFYSIGFMSNNKLRFVKEIVTKEEAIDFFCKSYQTSLYTIVKDIINSRIEENRD